MIVIKTLSHVCFLVFHSIVATRYKKKILYELEHVIKSRSQYGIYGGKRNMKTCKNVNFNAIMSLRGSKKHFGKFQLLF